MFLIKLSFICALEGMVINMLDSGKKDINKIIEEAAVSASKTEIDGRARPHKEARRLHRQLDVIREAYKKLVYSREQVTQAYEWLFDNYYILEREGRQVIKELWKCCEMPQSGGETCGAYAYRQAVSSRSG